MWCCRSNSTCHFNKTTKVIFCSATYWRKWRTNPIKVRYLHGILGKTTRVQHEWGICLNLVLTHLRMKTWLDSVPTQRVPGNKLGTKCDKCYRNEALALTSRMCYVCTSEKTNRQWFKSKVDSSFDLCRNCWVKEHATLTNKIFVSCKSKRTSSQWLKSKIVEGAC